MLVQERRNGKTAKQFFKCILKKHKEAPRKIIIDQLRSYEVARRELMPDVIYDTLMYANNGAELSHQPTRVRERVMRRFKSIGKVQRFLNVYTRFIICSLWEGI